MLPEGLHHCPVCGFVRGVTPSGAVSRCLCDGCDCRYCRLGRIFRPASVRYDPQLGRWRHTPYYARPAPCRHCMGVARRYHATTVWPAARDNARVGRLLGLVREAGVALRRPGPAPELPERPGIVALYEGGRPRLHLAERAVADVGVSAETPIAFWLPDRPRDLDRVFREVEPRWRERATY